MAALGEFDDVLFILTRATSTVHITLRTPQWHQSGAEPASPALTGASMFAALLGTPVVTLCGLRTFPYVTGGAERHRFVDRFPDRWLCRGCYRALPPEEQWRAFEHPAYEGEDTAVHAVLTPEQERLRALDLIAWGEVLEGHSAAGGRTGTVWRSSWELQTIDDDLITDMVTRGLVELRGVLPRRSPLLTRAGYEHRESLAPSIALVCLDDKHARAVATEWLGNGNPQNTARQDSNRVVIRYADPRFALDIADWAGEHGHAADPDAAAVIAAL